ncbi:MAG: DUF3293 domain-containing protein [Gemmatimonadota bacterium]|nr:DUF3293 domain-containing protein [Gemmatimonadota bacterium]
MPNDAVWTAYANTLLRIGGRRQVKIDLRQPLSDEIRRVLTDLLPERTFAIVTPFNPGGVRAPFWKNWWQHYRMRAHLASRGLRFVRANGESLDGTHRERGFAIAVGRGDAATFARSYRQLALYWFDGEAFWIDDVRTTRAPQRLP